MAEPEKTEAPAQKRGEPSRLEIFYPGNTEGHRDVIHVASFPEIVFFWPLMLAGFFCAALQGAGLSDGTGTGWLFLFVFLFNFLVLVQDFDQKQFFILVLVLVVATLGIWLCNLYGISIFKSLAEWLLSFQPRFSTHAFLLMSATLFLMLGWGCISALFDYWRFEQNEFVHFTQPVGRDLSIARSGCSVYKEIPDIFECLLTFGGGTLLIKRENQVVATIRNIPFLGKRMTAIEEMLSETRVTVAHEVKL
ncbi:MAG: hypothetical protein U0136_02660 [Bdellovibrionota bacterium]